jgi:hypothetical protein
MKEEYRLKVFMAKLPREYLDLTMRKWKENCEN